MLRYIIAVGNPKRASDFERITELRRRILNSPVDWLTAIDAPGIYAASEHCVHAPITLPENRGVIFGALYHIPERSLKNSSGLIRSIAGNEAELVIRSRGRSMMRDYWGYYVAALLCPEDSCCTVIRSPVSPLACF